MTLKRSSSTPGSISMPTCRTFSLINSTSQAAPQPRHCQPQPWCDDRAHARRYRSADSARTARLGAGLWRHQLHARRCAGCGQAARPRGARRGRPALAQPGHARRDQPRAHRPHFNAAVVPN